MLLDHLGYSNEANKIKDAVDQVLVKGTILTPDLGGKSTTDQVTNAIISAL
jgi:homoisocitrate dehydrogenase